MATSDSLLPPASIAHAAIPAIAEVVESPDDFLGKVDIGILNLICAVGLPGAEDLDIPKAAAWINRAADRVDVQTRAGFEGFAREPAAYNYSPGGFCCEHLLRTLQEGLGVRYNPARAAESQSRGPHRIEPDFRDSRDLFIHGMMGGPGGTCASMPVLYVAVGRRPGYPLKLVEAPGHLFFRWEDPFGRRFNVPEVFNVEGAGHGISFYPDDFYRTWPREWKPIEKNADWYLKSLSPAEELAAFLATRASCLEANGRIEEALQAFKWATQFAADDLRYKGKLTALLKQCYESGLQSLEAERRRLQHERIALEQKSDRLEHLALRSGSAPHGDSCQCLHCREARRAVQRPQVPGHPSGCGCFHCRNATLTPFGPW